MLHPVAHARTHPDKPAYIMAATGETVTYGELDRRANQGAHLLRALGVAPDLIERDFLATATALDTARLLGDTGFARGVDVSSRVVAAMMTVVPQYLGAAFAAIDERCGSFDRYRVEELGVDDADLARMRAILLEG